MLLQLVFSFALFVLRFVAVCSPAFISSRYHPRYLLP
jgi:hypothetical protein